MSLILKKERKNSISFHFLFLVIILNNLIYNYYINMISAHKRSRKKKNFFPVYFASF